MSVCDFSRLILLLSAVCTIEVQCNTTLPTEDHEDLRTERCSFVHLDTYTQQVETVWTSSNISTAFEKLHVQGVKDYLIIGTFSRKIQTAQWDFEIQLENGTIVIHTNVKMLQRDESLNKIRIKGIADIGGATKSSGRFSELDWYQNFRGKEELIGYSFIRMTTEEFGNMSDIVSLNLTAELVYAKAVQFEALGCQNNQSVTASFVESNDTRQGFKLPLPINTRNGKVRTIYEWTIQKPHLDYTAFSHIISETGFRIGRDDDAVRWDVNLEIWKFDKWQTVFLDIYDYSSEKLNILRTLNVNVTLVGGGTSRKMDLGYGSLDFVQHFRLEVSDDDLKEWKDSLTVVMTFDPVESIHSTTDSYFP